jgi:hypothetical protein
MCRSSHTESVQTNACQSAFGGIFGASKVIPFFALAEPGRMLIGTGSSAPELLE